MTTKTPWLPYLATDYLARLLNPSMTVFEYGSGESTLFLADHVKSVISVEHDREWHRKINAPYNVLRHLIEPTDGPVGTDKANPDHYTSGALLKDFRKYVGIIDIYNDLDIILIDGRSRPACLKHARDRVRAKGWIILDNTERPYYLANTLSLFDGWETIEFYGYGPELTWPWKTLFLRKP